MNIDQRKHEELTHKIIGCEMEVHSTLINGFLEVIYQRALEYELEVQNMHFACEVEMPVYYKDLQVDSRRVEFLIEDVLSVELKAVIKLEDVHWLSNKSFENL